MAPIFTGSLDASPTPSHHLSPSPSPCRTPSSSSSTSSTSLSPSSTQQTTPTHLHPLRLRRMPHRSNIRLGLGLSLARSDSSGDFELHSGESHGVGPGTAGTTPTSCYSTTTGQGRGGRREWNLGYEEEIKGVAGAFEGEVESDREELEQVDGCKDSKRREGRIIDGNELERKFREIEAREGQKQEKILDGHMEKILAAREGEIKDVEAERKVEVVGPQEVQSATMKFQRGTFGVVGMGMGFDDEGLYGEQEEVEGWRKRVGGGFRWVGRRMGYGGRKGGMMRVEANVNVKTSQ